MISSRPSQKCGTDRPTSATRRDARSRSLCRAGPRRSPPPGCRSAIATNMLRNASSSVIGMRVTIVCATGSSRWSTPRSPCSASQIQCAYCTGSGRSSRYLWRTAASTAGSRFSAPSAIAGSPGIARTPRNTSMLASTSTTRAAPTLRRRKPPIVSRSARSSLLLVRRVRDAEQRVRVELDARQLRSGHRRA